MLQPVYCVIFCIQITFVNIRFICQIKHIFNLYLNGNSGGEDKNICDLNNCRHYSILFLSELTGVIFPKLQVKSHNILKRICNVLTM